MKISIDQNSLLEIIGELQMNCDLLSDTWGEYAESDVELYVPIIRHLLDELQALAMARRPRKAKRRQFNARTHEH